jgi:hypothetical protein
MQHVSKQRIGEHAYNNKGIVGNGVFYSVRAKWSEGRIQLTVGSRVQEFQLSSYLFVGVVSW